MHYFYGEDSFVLAKLVETIGMFVYCCGTDQKAQRLASEVFTFVWSFRFKLPTSDQKELLLTRNNSATDTSKGVTSVRRAVLAAMLRCLLALSMESLAELLGANVDPILNWLFQTHKNDADALCRDLAASCVGALQQKMSVQQE